MNEADDIEPACAAYKDVRPKYEKLASEIQDIIKNELAVIKLAPVSLTHRAKTVDSFTEKIERKHYTNPLSQITDLAGVRVVCTYEPELAKVAKVIETNFVVKESIDKALELGVDRMGYNGKAFVVTLGGEYKGGRYKGITNLNCEIQVRTVLQDAWATINHQLVYKNEETTPERLRRDLNNVASLLEVAQGVFDSVKQKREIYVGEIQEKKDDRHAFLAQPLDFDTVIAYTRWKFPECDVSEKLTQILLKDINLEKYPTLEQLDGIIDRASDAVNAYQEEMPSFFKNGTDFITKSLGFVDSEFRSKHGFATKTRAAFDRHQNLVLGTEA